MIWFASSVPPIGAEPGFPWGTFILLVTTAISAAVAIYTARSARAANRETIQLASWKDLVTASRQEITALRTQQKQDEEDNRREITDLKERVDTLTRRIDQSERRERALILWARSAVSIMRAQGISFPVPPPGVEETDPGTTRTQVG